MATHLGSARAIVAVAGRRIDATDARVSRFPLKNVPKVRAEIAEMLRRRNAVTVVASAACGADLIALEEAERLGLRRRIVLPFPPDKFRTKSVVDRPGPWGTSYDHLVAAAQRENNLVPLDIVTDSDDEAYMAATTAIIMEAQIQARMITPERCDLVAMTVWDGVARAQTDLTNMFRTSAIGAGFEDVVIPTI